jgi:O-antigen/teichoic acid export membrane protein
MADRRSVLSRGLAWNALFQAFQVAISFGSMVILSRIIPQDDYGRAGAVVAVLTLVNAFGCGQFISQSLQLPDGVEPDWGAHWTASFWIQLGLSAAVHLIAGICWFLPTYRSIALLLHVGAVGLVLDWPNKIGGALLWRAMDFRRLRIVHAISAFFATAVTVVMGIRGQGALAIVVGANLLSGLPFAVDLLVVRGWRPPRGWLRWPDWRAYRASLHFGLQRAGSSLVASAKDAIATAILPSALGFAAMGLLGRATGLLSSTVGRLTSALSETVYPVLPRYAAQPATYPQKATLFLQALLWTTLPAVIFVGFEGPLVSRVLYGTKWVAMDPLIAPAAIGVAALTAGSAANSVLLAANRLRLCFALDVAGACLTAPMAIVAWSGGGMLRYSWALAAGQVVFGIVSLVAATGYLAPRWPISVLLPPLVAGATGAAAMMGIDRLVALPQIPHLLVVWSAFTVAALLAGRLLFPGELARIVALLPGRDKIARGLLLPVSPASGG